MTNYTVAVFLASVIAIITILAIMQTRKFHQAQKAEQTCKMANYVQSTGEADFLQSHIDVGTRFAPIESPVSDKEEALLGSARAGVTKSALPGEMFEVSTDDLRNVLWPATAPLPWGCVAGNLTQIGNAWIDMRRVVLIEFHPEDGCGLEINFEHDSETFHLPTTHIAPMKAWLKQQAEMDMMQLKSDLAYAASQKPGDLYSPLHAPRMSRIVTEEMIASI